ncbi:FABP family protein [Corallococcus sp. AB045]|uniref:FABP family protein n=1 Tax=Corallococcus sp. AB045 TaxID=2316719 RepID=UPI0011C3DB91|nr:FABP family protein [Corallococcus sp. AB045]
MLQALSACATGPQRHEQPPLAAPAVAELTEALKPFSFLMGTWDAEGGGTPGASAGTFTFQPDVQGHVLIRRNESVTPGGRHEDLMVLHPGAQGAVRASYFDNEGHVIQYAARAESSPASAEFVTDEASGAPRFRLSYLLNTDGTLNVRFEIAPPGGAGFRTYLEGTARRR